MNLSTFSVLSAEEVRKIHAASLQVMAQCGLKITYGPVQDLLEAAGAEVDRATGICKFPSELVERCISTVPAQFDLYDREGNPVLRIGNGIPCCASGHNAVFCMDSTSPQRRYATLKDVEEFGAVSQWCQSIDMVGVPLNPQDVPASSTLLHATRALFETTTKPLFLSTESSRVVKSLLAMMQAVAGTEEIGSRPNAIIQLSPSSPLFWDSDVLEGVLATCAARVPLTILPEPMSGVSAPYSVAGLLTEHNIELLSGVVIAQLAAPGTPLVYGSSWTTYDMRYSSALIGRPESALLTIAGCQMARFYGMPSHTTATNSDANALDQHQGWESVLNNFTAMNAPNDIVMNSGMFACGLTTSLEQLVIDNEVNRIIKRLRRGIQVDETSIAADSIMEVGPTGNFLMEDLTLENLYTDEFFQPTIRINTQYDAWISDGAPTVDRVAARMVQDILAQDNPVPLAPAVSAALKAIIADFEAET